MCQPASFIVTKDSVLWSKVTESHEDILSEFGFHMDGARGPNGARVELSPRNGLFWTDPAMWVFKIDQDAVPEWWDAADAERRVKAAALNWQATKIIKPDQRRDEIKKGEFVLFSYGTVQEIWGGTVQEILGGTVQEIWGGTVQEILGGTVQAYEHVDPAILTGPHAVLIDRSGEFPVCHVGKEQK
ncbi:MAG: hypothetical protein WC565_08135 [Parcubacteria group bacterium]